MPCVYFNDNSCTFTKHHETKGVFYRHICSYYFAQDGKVSTHGASDCKKSVKKQLTLGMVDRAQLQPGQVQENFLDFSKNGPAVVYSTPANVVNNKYSCRFVYNQSVSDFNILKQISVTRATWRKCLAASDSCKPVIPGKSYAEVLKTDSQLQCMHSHAKNGVDPQQGRPLGKLAGWEYHAPTKKLSISLDSPAHKILSG